jgi:hypothetical protein
MGRIINVGRAGKVSYGTNLNFTFSIQFPTISYVNAMGMNPKWDSVNSYYTSALNSQPPTTGTITVAGVTVTLAAADILTPAAVAAKIVATSIAGYTVTIFTPQMSTDIATVSLTSTTVGPITVPTVVLGTATNILFINKIITQGIAFPSIGDLDDIWIGGRTPVGLTVTYTGGTIPDIKAAYGTYADQQAGTLVYGSALTLSGGQITLTAPVNWLRMTTKASNTQANLFITR